MQKHKNITELENKYIGHLISFEGREFKILTYKQKGDTVQIVTDDGKWINTNAFDLGIVIDQFVIIKSNELQVIDKKMSAAPIFFNVENKVIEKTQDVLMNLLDGIEKNKFDPNKINAAVNITNAVIQTEKVKIQMVASMNKLADKF